MQLSRYLAKRNTSAAVRFFCTSSKFPEDTISGVVKEARAKNEWKDLVRFDGQNFNWNVKEFDVYSSAFAYGLVEQGYQPGDKLLLWLDAEHSAESATAQVGAHKAGVSIVTVDDLDEIHDVANALEESGSRGMLLSPHTKADAKTQRANLLLELMPELTEAYPGQLVTHSNFPNLKSVMHTGHQTIRGTTKFKENMLYTKKRLTNLRLPGTKSGSVAMECYTKGELVTSLSHSDIINKANDIWEQYLNGEDKHLPVFLTLSLQYPLGFATFLACTMNGRKVFVPSTYNVAKIAKSFNFQKSDVLVCEEDVFTFEPPAHKYDEVREHVSNFRKALVAGKEGGSKAESNVFTNVDATHTNFYLQ